MSQPPDPAGPYPPPGAYGPGAYPPGGYAPPGNGPAGATPPTDQRAIWALVMSILGFACCPVVFSVVGLVLAIQSETAIQASAGTLGGEGIAKAAKILSIIGIVLGLLLAVGAVVGLLVLQAGSATRVG